MARSKTSQRWLKEHFDDPYVKMAQRDGYRSRASYKLLEIQEKDRILRPGMTVVDLGAAPGGWSQVTSRVIGDRGRLIASDILEMDSIPDVTFIQGDFTEDAVFARILEAIGDHPVDLVISDMAPNMSGVRAADQPRAMYLCELALDLAGRVLRPGGVSTSTTSRPGKCSTRYRCASPCRRVIVRGNSICSHAAFAGNRLE